MSVFCGSLLYACLFAVVVYGAFNLPRIIRSLRRRGLIRRCLVCGVYFAIGINGVEMTNGVLCDECAGVKRDKDGQAWFPNEGEGYFLDRKTGEVEVVTRAEALGEGR